MPNSTINMYFDIIRDYHSKYFTANESMKQFYRERIQSNVDALIDMQTVLNDGYSPIHNNYASVAKFMLKEVMVP